MAQSDNLTKNQRDFVDALLAGLSVEAAGKRTGLSKTTSYRWASNEAIQQAFAHGQKLVVEKAIQKLRLSSEAAAIVLIRNLQADTGVPSSLRRVQIQAAVSILELVRQNELNELADRMTAMEQLLAERTEEIVIPYGKHRTNHLSGFN